MVTSSDAKLSPSIVTTACENGTVDLQATDFYPDGLPFMCFSGVPHYLEYGQFAGETMPTTSSPIQNTVVACSQLLDQDNSKCYHKFTH